MTLLMKYVWTFFCVMFLINLCETLRPKISTKAQQSLPSFQGSCPRNYALAIGGEHYTETQCVSCVFQLDCIKHPSPACRRICPDLNYASDRLTTEPPDKRITQTTSSSTRKSTQSTNQQDAPYRNVPPDPGPVDCPTQVPCEDKFNNNQPVINMDMSNMNTSNSAPYIGLSIVEAVLIIVLSVAFIVLAFKYHKERTLRVKLQNRLVTMMTVPNRSTVSNDSGDADVNRSLLGQSDGQHGQSDIEEGGSSGYGDGDHSSLDSSRQNAPFSLQSEVSDGNQIPTVPRRIDSRHRAGMDDEPMEENSGTDHQGLEPKPSTEGALLSAMYTRSLPEASHKESRNQSLKPVSAPRKGGDIGERKSSPPPMSSRGAKTDLKAGVVQQKGFKQQAERSVGDGASIVTTPPCTPPSADDTELMKIYTDNSQTTPRSKRVNTAKNEKNTMSDGGTMSYGGEFISGPLGAENGALPKDKVGSNPRKTGTVATPAPTQDTRPVARVPPTLPSVHLPTVPHHPPPAVPSNQPPPNQQPADQNAAVADEEDTSFGPLTVSDRPGSNTWEEGARGEAPRAVQQEVWVPNGIPPLPRPTSSPVGDHPVSQPSNVVVRSDGATAPHPDVSHAELS